MSSLWKDILAEIDPRHKRAVRKPMELCKIKEEIKSKPLSMPDIQFEYNIHAIFGSKVWGTKETIQYQRKNIIRSLHAALYDEAQKKFLALERIVYQECFVSEGSELDKRLINLKEELFEAFPNE